MVIEWVFPEAGSAGSVWEVLDNPGEDKIDKIQ